MRCQSHWMSISIDTCFRFAQNRVIFVGCRCRDFSEVCNMFHICSMGFKSAKHRVSIEYVKVSWMLLEPVWYYLCRMEGLHILTGTKHHPPPPRNMVSIKEYKWSATRFTYIISFKTDSNFTSGLCGSQQNTFHTITDPKTNLSNTLLTDWTNHAISFTHSDHLPLRSGNIICLTRYYGPNLPLRGTVTDAVIFYFVNNYEILWHAV